MRRMFWVALRDALTILSFILAVSAVYVAFLVIRHAIYKAVAG